MKRINGEPVKLVESFDELREGMIAWVSPCRWCGRNHRHILVRGPIARTVLVPTGGQEKRMAFLAEPPASCDASARWWLHGGAGNLFRVIDEQLDADSTGERATRELEHAR